ncbi:MAG: cupin domain-containing protein [Atribacterota bacterium]
MLVGVKAYQFKTGMEKCLEQIVNMDIVQINHIVLPPGERVPEHYSNSNVFLIIAKGAMTITIERESHEYPHGYILAIPYHQRMLIENKDKEMLEFFVVKAPHPEHYSANPNDDSRFQ